MGRLVSVVLALLLAGCKPAQITLAVDPGFYPSAVAHDPVSGRFFVGELCNRRNRDGAAATGAWWRPSGPLPRPIRWCSSPTSRERAGCGR